VAMLKLLNKINIFKSEKDSFEEVYFEHKNLVRNVIYRIVGGSSLDDLVQETFVQVWKSLPQFKKNSSLKTWIYRIAVNQALMHLRKKDILNSHQVEQFEFPIDEQTSNIENKDMANFGLANVKNEFKVVLVLFYYEGLTIEEISSILEIPSGTVKSRLHQAKIEFARVFKKEYSNEE
jgi:RNA polymerase sigma-70 factor (ECF subfamily)